MGMSGHASGEAVVGVTIAMACMAGIVVLLRLFTRIFIVKSPGLEDGFITASLLFSIATTVTMCLQVHWGMARHMNTLTLHESVESQKPFWASVWLYNIAIGCTKYSILLQYLRIFPQRTMRRATYAMLGVNTIYVLWTTLSAIFACWPIDYFWTMVRHPASGGRCLDRFAVWFANAGMNIATDIAIGVLPLPMLRQLHLPKRQRIALMVVFGLGGFTCLISILRLQSLLVISRAQDITWENPLAAIWSCVEINTGILCSSLPTLKAAFSRFLPSLFGTTQHASNGNAGTPHLYGGRPHERSQPEFPYDHSNHNKDKRRSSRLSPAVLKRYGTKLPFDALGRGLNGRGEPTQSQCSTAVSGTGHKVGSGRTRNKTDTSTSSSSGAGEIEMSDLGVGQQQRSSEGWERRIQVVTTVEQDVQCVGDVGAEKGRMRGTVRERDRDDDVEKYGSDEKDREGSEVGSEKELCG